MAGLSHFVLSGSDRKDRFFFLFSLFFLSSLRPLCLLFSSSALNPFLLFLHLDAHSVSSDLKLLQLLRFLLLDHPVSPPRNSFHGQRPQPNPLQLLQRMLLLEQCPPQLFLFRIPHPHFIPIIRRPPSRCIRLPYRLHSHANFFSQPL